MKKEEGKELRWFENLSTDQNQEAQAGVKTGPGEQKAAEGGPPVNLEKHIAEVYGWLNEIAALLGAKDRLDWAYRALRGVLHTLRDRMPPEEVFQLSAQLPLLIRGIFFEGYRLTGKPDKIDKAELLTRIEKELGPGTVIKARTAFMAVLGVLYNHVSEGELDDIYATMPKDIKEFWERSLKSASYS